jgi:hypothetical protein
LSEGILRLVFSTSNPELSTEEFCFRAGTFRPQASGSERIWELQEPLDFPGTVFGVERGPAGTMLPEMLRRYTRAWARIGRTPSCRTYERRS